MLNRAAMVADYQRKFDTMIISRTAAVEGSARRIVAGMGRYLVVEKMTGVPADFIGVLHDREASCNFSRFLANGDCCIGNGRKTQHVPRGRGPFSTWEASAIDALRSQGFLEVHDWSPGVIAFEGEEFNGEGYHNHAVENPYLWGGCNYYHKGKYIRDGVYDRNFVDPQVGIMPIIKRVLELVHPTVAAPPLVIQASPDHKTILGAPALHPADKVAVVQHSRFLRFQEYYANLIKYLGLTGTTAAALIPQVASFCTDWRTLTVAGVLGGAWIASEFGAFNLLRAAAQGRYTPSGLVTPIVIPAADGDNYPNGMPQTVDGLVHEVKPGEFDMAGPAPEAPA